MDFGNRAGRFITKFLRTSLILAAVMGILISSSFAMGQFLLVGHPLEGEPAPDFTLKNLKGENVNLTLAREGKPAILFFWATWCPHCRSQLDELQGQAAVIEQKGIKLILVDLGETAIQVREYFSRKKILLDSLLDDHGNVADTYKVVGVPSYFFIGENGRIRNVDYVLSENYEEIFRER